MVESDRFLFTDNLNGDEIGYGFILLKIVLGDIKPSTVIGVPDLEEKLASATLQEYENNVLSCTMDMEKQYKEIRRLKPGTYNDKRFLAQLFRALETTKNEIFDRTVDVVKDKWILGESTCTVTYVIKICNTKYRFF